VKIRPKFQNKNVAKNFSAEMGFCKIESLPGNIKLVGNGKLPPATHHTKRKQ
jgi:hypothetical protein